MGHMAIFLMLLALGTGQRVNPHGVHFGVDAAVIEDRNEDGAPDVLAGWNSSRRQSSFLILDGRTGARIETIPVQADWGRLSDGLAALGDLDGDGFGEVACVFERQVTPGSGWRLEKRVAIYSGKTLQPWRAHDSFDRCLGGWEDLDGDEVDEYILDSPELTAIVSGKTGDVLSRLGGRAKSPVRLVEGEALRPRLLADLNRDGWPELARIGPAQGSPALVTSMLLVNGRSGEKLGELSLASVSEWGAWCVTMACRHVSEDEALELSLGNPTHASNQGRVSFWRFEAGKLEHTANVSPASLLESKWTQPGREHGFGASATPVSDLDGDGTPDWLIGAPDMAFVAYVVAVSGKDRQLIWQHQAVGQPEGCHRNPWIGVGAHELPDIDGDEIPELLVHGGLYYTTVPDGHVGSIRLLSGGSGKLIWNVLECKLGVIR